MAGDGEWRAANGELVKMPRPARIPPFATRHSRSSPDKEPAMLNAYPTPGGDKSLAGRNWIDLIDPTEAERSAFEAAFGLRVPTRDELGEIEATSRLQLENGALYMTAPLIFAMGDEPWLPSPTGFVLSKQVLMNARFAKSASFDAVGKACGI